MRLPGRRRRYQLLAFVGIALMSASLGNWIGQRRMERRIAENDERISALSREVAMNANGRQSERNVPTGTSGRELVDEIKRELQSEMGLLPMRKLRDLRESFVELHAYGEFGEASYGTAGYLGGGYFITVKHIVLPLAAGGRKTASARVIKIRYNGEELKARVVDSGNADSEVHPGDWAIIKVDTNILLPPLHVDTAYAFQFGDPILRLGNDYSKGIMMSTGYVGQRMPNGLVTCLTDGHPGVSGGGVVDQNGTLVGIPVGRMDGDYRFSFILPIREEMFRRVSSIATN